LPPFVDVFKAIAHAKTVDPGLCIHSILSSCPSHTCPTSDVGTIKVTAFDDLSISRDAVKEDDDGHIDVIAYPSGTH